MNVFKNCIEQILDVEIEELESNSEYTEDNIIQVGDKYLRIISIDRNIIEAVKKMADLQNYEKDKQMLLYARENFINDVVNFKFDKIDLMLNRSEILGFNFYIKRQAIIIEVENLYTMLKDKNELVLQKFKQDFSNIILKSLKNSKDIVSYVGDNKFLICKSEEENLFLKLNNLLESLKSIWDLKYNVGVGDNYDMPGIEALSYSYKDAVKYLEVGKKFLPEESVFSFGNVGVYLVLDSLDRFSRAKIRGYVYDILEYGKKNDINIKKFLEVLFSNNFKIKATLTEMNLSTTKGKEIIQKIMEITNLDPLKFEDAVKFYIALKIWRE